MKIILYGFLLAGILLAATSCSSITSNRVETIQDETNNADTLTIEDTDKIIDETVYEDIEAEKVENTDNEIPSSYGDYIDNLQYLAEIEVKMPLATTTVEMVETRIDALKAWDAELNKIYALLLQKLKDDDIEKLRAAERLWIEVRDRKADYVYSLGGSLAAVDYNDILFEFTKERTLELISIYYEDSKDFGFNYVYFETVDIQEKYYGNTESYVELDLKLPKLYGSYEGIPVINKFFEDKEDFFYNQLPFDVLLHDEQYGKVEGRKNGFFISAYYFLSTRLGDIVSISAFLDGGAGGVSWVGTESNAFDLNTGKKLALSDIFSVSEDEYMEFIYDFVSKEIMENMSSDYGYFFEDAYSEEGIRSIRDYNKDDFMLTKNALVIFYEKYALAHGAAGVQYFEIPYEAIIDILAIDISEE